ncbi:uncharacterized protein LOC126972838 isoform X2 [Leptidea sinapis]|uniref:uncharacterized protein LOC126972838 isoform X2 n=1 Tax=Leptidea sinapis TaxID=189913 RepID=UPI0021C29447|nr:uncharacterized protein LOC126972838 isoform X2 [Leptidea sinapis]
MSGKTVSFNTHYDLSESHLESIAKWVSCNGEVWGMGPTVVFASAAALFLFSELQETVLVGGDHGQITVLEKSLVSTMVVGMLALMTHLWVCSMRFFQYYLDTLIRDSPNIILEMTTAGFLGGQVDVVPLGPLTRFLKQQQPQIHITICWFLSLCYADYVRKHYCHSFNMPYLEQWQLELHERATRGMQRTMDKVNSFVGAVHQRLRTYSSRPDSIVDAHTGGEGAGAMLARRDLPSASLEVSRTASRVSFAATATAPATCSLAPRHSHPLLGAGRVDQASDTTPELLEKFRACVTNSGCCSPQPSNRVPEGAGSEAGSVGGGLVD